MSVAIKNLPRYLNSDTDSMCSPYASKSRSKFSLVSFSASRRLFLYTPFAHCTVPGWRPFSALRGTCMSHLEHRGWGKFPSSSITTVSRTCRCTKCTHIAVLVARAPGTPPRGISSLPSFLERTSGIPGGPCPLSGFSTGVFALPLSHVESSYESTLIQPPAVHRTPHTPPDTAVVLCTIFVPL